MASFWCTCVGNARDGTQCEALAVTPSSPRVFKIYGLSKVTAHVTDELQSFVTPPDPLSKQDCFGCAYHVLPPPPIVLLNLAWRECLPT